MGKHHQKVEPGWVSQETALSLLDTSKRTLGRMVKTGDVEKTLIEKRVCYSIDSINRLISETTGASPAGTGPFFSPGGMRKLRGYWTDEPSERGVLLAVEMGARMHALQREIGKTLTASLVRDALAAEEKLATRVTIPEQEQASWEAYQQRGQDALFNDGHLENVKRLVAEGEISGLEAVQRVEALRDELKRLRPLPQRVEKLACEAATASESHRGEVAILKKVAAVLQQQHEADQQAQADAHSRAMEEAAIIAAADKDAAVWDALQAKPSADAERVAAVQEAIEGAQLLAVVEKAAAVKVAARGGYERVAAAEARVQLAEIESQKRLAALLEQQAGYEQLIRDLADKYAVGLDTAASAMQEALEASDSTIATLRTDLETRDGGIEALKTELGAHRTAGEKQFMWKDSLDRVLQQAGFPDANRVFLWLDKYSEEFKRDLLPLLKQDMSRHLVARKEVEESFLVASRTQKAWVDALNSLICDNS